MLSRAETADRPLRASRALCAWFSALLMLAASVDIGLADDWAEPMPLVGSSLLLDVGSRGSLIIAVGERGHILLSSDRGAHWRQAEVPTRSTLTAVWMGDRDRVWAVGHDGLILRSQDGGQSWSRQRSSSEPDRPLLDVWFADSKHGIAIGAYGLMLSTEDGGATWRQRNGDDDGPHANAIAQAPDGALYIAGEFGTISRSDNRGRTWQQLASPYRGSFFGILTLDDGAILVFGLRGHLFRSDDRGTSWQRLETGTTATLLTSLVLADGSVVIAGIGGVLLLSDDAGRSFELQDRADRHGIAALIELPNQLLAVGDGGLTRIPVPGPPAKATANLDLR